MQIMKHKILRKELVRSTIIITAKQCKVYNNKLDKKRNLKY
jgi:hypothetical protein